MATAGPSEELSGKGQSNAGGPTIILYYLTGVCDWTYSKTLVFDIIYIQKYKSSQVSSE